MIKGMIAEAAKDARINQLLNLVMEVTEDDIKKPEYDRIVEEGF
jgi:hypothetical protein